MGRIHDVLKWANRSAVAEEITRRGYRVSGETLNRWVRQEKEVPAVVEHIVFDLFGISPDNRKEPPPWAEALAGDIRTEVRLNREAIQKQANGHYAAWARLLNDLVAAEADPQLLRDVVARAVEGLQVDPPGQ